LSPVSDFNDFRAMLMNLAYKSVIASKSYSQARKHRTTANQANI